MNPNQLAQQKPGTYFRQRERCLKMLRSTFNVLLGALSLLRDRREQSRSQKRTDSSPQVELTPPPPQNQTGSQPKADTPRECGMVAPLALQASQHQRGPTVANAPSNQLRAATKASPAGNRRAKRREFPVGVHALVWKSLLLQALRNQGHLPVDWQPDSVDTFHANQPARRALRGDILREGKRPQRFVRASFLPE